MVAARSRRRERLDASRPDVDCLEESTHMGDALPGATPDRTGRVLQVSDLHGLVDRAVVDAGLHG